MRFLLGHSLIFLRLGLSSDLKITAFLAHLEHDLWEPSCLRPCLNTGFAGYVLLVLAFYMENMHPNIGCHDSMASTLLSKSYLLS